jgi:diguanylate cyclase (GGDEF)-like protein
MSIADTLTNLPGSPALEEALKREIEAERPVALGWLDLDRFVEVNDDFGSAVGDRVLQTLAALLAEGVPGGVYRIAGDEFAILLPGVSLEQAFLRLEGLRARVVEASARFGLPDGRPVTISIGVAHAPRDAKHPRALFQAADSALGAVKENGGNAVGLPFTEEMVMKSCYYPATSLRRLKGLAERLKRKESTLLREALDDLFRKYDAPREG